MKILVTGGAGFIGSHTVDWLLARGHTARILDNLTPPVHLAGQWPAYLPTDHVETILGDVRDRSAWEAALAGVDTVIHLAAYQDYLPDFSKFFHVNCAGTALMYEIIVEKKLPIRKVVIGSSQASYGEGKYACPVDGVVYPGQRSETQLRARDWEVKCPQCGGALQWQVTPEAALVNPANAYGMSKFAQEMLAINLGKRYNIPTVGMRYSIVQGPRQSFRNAYSGALRIFAMQALAGQRPTVYEDGQQIRDFVYVGDVAQANLLVLEDDRANHEAFNVGGGKGITVEEFARVMIHASGRDLKPHITQEYRFGDTRHIFSDVSKLRALGWEPTGSVEQNCREYIEWATKQPDFRDYASEAREHMQRVGTVRGGTDEG
ncbi:MAG TPA: NAD-dependent epimerase/dehydratase family protein [Anaerolineales bacterium]|nr:NAD-dependent epimerase/dehydratase family protein [Anaerolineales bacterium]